MNLVPQEGFLPSAWEQSLLTLLFKVLFQWRGQRTEEKRLEKRVEQLKQGQKLLLVVTIVLLVVTLSRAA